MRILIAGDVHGDWAKLNQLISKKNPDMVMQCGDFGWWPKMETMRSVLYHMPTWKVEGLKTNGVPVLWCDGNHEDHYDLERIRNEYVDHSNGIQIYPTCHYMPRGSTYTLDDGRVVLFIGGADSIDKDRRTLGIDWFQEELIRQEDLDRCMSLETVDIVISHTAPCEWVPDICRGDKFNDPSRVALSMILEKHKPEIWAHGHWHREASGKYGRTRWYSLDYPGHGGKWWKWLESM